MRTVSRWAAVGAEGVAVRELLGPHQPSGNTNRGSLPGLSTLFGVSEALVAKRIECLGCPAVDFREEVPCGRNGASPAFLTAGHRVPQEKRFMS